MIFLTGGHEMYKILIIDIDEVFLEGTVDSEEEFNLFRSYHGRTFKNKILNKDRFKIKKDTSYGVINACYDLIIMAGGCYVE